MHPDSIPIPHEGGELHLGPITEDVKRKFCAWLKPRYILEAIQVVEDAQAENAQYPGSYSDDDIKRLQVSAELARDKANARGIYWSADPSGPVAEALRTDAGGLRLARLMFGDCVKAWTDADLMAYLEANGEGTAYHAAFQIQWEYSDPKAKRPAPTSAGRPGATSSTTS